MGEFSQIDLGERDQSAVDVFTVSNLKHEYNQTIVFDAVKYPVYSNSYPINIDVPSELSTAAWARLFCQRLDSPQKTNLVSVS
jgi:hypothetical protein